MQSFDLQDLVDMDVFYSARNVVDALKKHNCTEALQWCAENSARLKKMKVTEINVCTTSHSLVLVNTPKI